MITQPDWIPLVSLIVFFVAPLAILGVAALVARMEARRPQPRDETGDPINPQALSDWRKANREAFK
jgi:hypothetical protein